MPKLGETTDRVLVIEWEHAVGDDVVAGDILLRVETDKVEADVPSPVAGTLIELLVAAGDEVEVGAAIAVFERS
jgi:pyruvate/2-oxoglutarate dehydrogenase complex dihydrolipoamide acyltransferase (E2) component